MSRRGRALLAGAALLLAGGMAWAAATGEQLLRGSQQAERVHDYRGSRTTRMFFPRTTLTAVTHVIHRHPATTRIEYSSPASLAGTVVLQVGSDRWRRSPHDRGWQRVSGPPELEMLDLLVRNYDLDLGPASTVANRNCWLLLVSPKHEGNPSRRLWVDRATGLVLRSELLNWKQDSISVSAFQEVEIDPDLSRELALLTPPAPPSSPPLRAPLAFKPTYPRHLPPGYTFAGTEVMTMGKYSAAHLRYSDGLNSISVFQAPADAFAQQMPLATVELQFTQVVTWRRGDLAYAIVGDINPAELQRMAGSMGAPAGAGGR